MSTPDRAPTVIVHKPTFAQLPLVAITPSRSNPRKHFDAGKLAELAASIAAFGVHQPIIVRPLPGDRVADTHRAVQYELVCGERRYRASQQAQVDTIPAMIRALTDDEVLEVQIVENLQRTDLSELEEAEGYEALMQHSDLTADQVGAKIGKSRSYVYARLKLLDLSVECKQALREGRIDASRALLIARIPDGKLQLKALDYATKSEYTGEPPSVRKLQDWLKANVMLRLEHAIFKLTDVRLVEAAGACPDCPKRTGANPDLFADVDGADICTDPACYHAKEDAHRQQLINRAQAKGMRIVQEQEALDMLEGRNHRSKPADYDDMATLRPELCDEGTRPATLGQLLGKDAPAPILFIHPRTQQVSELVPTDEARAVLLAKGLIKTEQARATKVEDLQHEIEHLKRAAENKVQHASDRAIFDATSAAIQATPTDQAHALLSPEFLRAWLFVQLDEHDPEVFSQVIGYQIADGMDEQDAITHHVQHLGATDVIRAVACVMHHDDWAGNTGPYKTQDVLTQQLGINTKAITKAATAAVRADYAQQIKELQAQIDAAAAPKPPAPDAAKSDLPHAPAARPNVGAGVGKKPKGGKPAKVATAAPKTSPEEAMQGIAAALQGIEGQASAPGGAVAPAAAPDGSGHALTTGTRVRITINLDRLGTTARKWAGRKGTITKTNVDHDPDFFDVSFKGRTGGIATFRTDQLEPCEVPA